MKRIGLILGVVFIVFAVGCGGRVTPSLPPDDHQQAELEGFWVVIQSLENPRAMMLEVNKATVKSYMWDEGAVETNLFIHIELGETAYISPRYSSVSGDGRDQWLRAPATLSTPVSFQGLERKRTTSQLEEHLSVFYQDEYVTIVPLEPGGGVIAFVDVEDENQQVYPIRFHVDETATITQDMAHFVWLNDLVAWKIESVVPITHGAQAGVYEIILHNLDRGGELTLQAVIDDPSQFREGRCFTILRGRRVDESHHEYTIALWWWVDE